ncbi:MAG: hypothetical protein IKK52_00175 [Alphaproteobacteria bacterium]|nr:hypothetical protein [Alphaproteobacteria bacterium]
MLMKEDYKKLRTALLTYTNDSSVGEMAALELFTVITNHFANVVSSDDDKKMAFFAIMKNIRDLYEIDEVQTTKLLELVYTCIKNELGSSSQYPSWMGWQVNQDKMLVKVMVEFVKRNATWCVVYDNSSNYDATRKLIKILPFNQEEFLVDDFGGSCNLKDVLARNSYHNVIINCLVSSPYEWMRWPEFIWDRLKANSISRGWLADKLQVRGICRKRRVVKMISRKVQQQKRGSEK